jgi:hypothetical protein
MKKYVDSVPNILYFSINAYESLKIISIKKIIIVIIKNI